MDGHNITELLARCCLDELGQLFWWGLLGGRKVLYALANTSTEVGMSWEQLGDFRTRGNVWNQTCPCGHQSRDRTSGSTPRRTMRDPQVMLAAWSPTVPKRSRRGDKLSPLREQERCLKLKETVFLSLMANSDLVFEPSPALIPATNQ